MSTSASSSPLRLLVLTSGTGAGHDARAAAFADWVAHLAGPGRAEVRIEQMLEDSSVVGRTGVGLYNTIQRRAPWLHHPYFLFVEGLSLINRDSISFGRRHYEAVLRDFRPRLVLSMHDCLNRGYFAVARRVLGAGSVRCATYCGEFHGGYGYSRNWVDRTADAFYPRTVQAASHARRLGIPGAALRRPGHLLGMHAAGPVWDDGARRRCRRDRLRLDPDRPTLLLATGGAGANNHLALLESLLPHADGVQAIVICGRSPAVRDAVGRWGAAHRELRLAALGFTDSVPMLLRCSDAVVARPGANTSAEALYAGTPILFNGIGGVMPQERLTVRYFAETAGSPVLRRASDLGPLVGRMLAAPAEFAAATARFRSLRPGPADGPERIVRELLELAGEAEGG